MMEDSVELVTRLLKAALGADKFTYYDGDPDLIPEHHLPAITVELMSDLTEAASYASDDETDTILVKVILNKKDDWTGVTDDIQNMTHKKLRGVRARDAVTKRYLPNTIKGALRPELYGDNRIMERMEVQLGELPRPDDVITAEAHCTITVLKHITVEPLQT